MILLEIVVNNGKEQQILFQDDTNVYKLRLGIVLDENEGALPKMIFYDKKGLGSPIGSGNQYMPWVHVDDAVSVFSMLFIEKNSILELIM